LPRAPATLKLGVMTDQPPDAPDRRVRQLVADDWTELRAARLAALAEAPHAFGSTLAREQAFTEDVWRLRAGSGRTFGAFDGAQIVGLATGFPADGLPATGATVTSLPGDDQPVWHLVGMWVAPGCRGQGVAARLVDAICEQARQAGARTVTLRVTEVNDRARTFYRRFGFTPTGARQLVRPDEPDHWEEELALRLS
jgi:ribosomal protein S18 acetylase RimI-like enzyme